MRAHFAWIALLVCGWSAAAAQGAAQAIVSPFAEGIRAYQNLDFDQAAALLRRDLARASGATASTSERAQGLVYLGAADLFRGRRDSAVAVFRRLVQLDPRYRPDRLVFPPEVTSVFDNVRVDTRAVVLVAPADTQIATGTGAYAFWVVASAFQTVDVTLRYQDGAPFRALYAGPMGDSLRVQWDGLDAAGQLPPVSRVLLRVASRAPTGELAGIVQLPLELRVAHLDTLPWPKPPADSLFLPERAGGRAALRALLGGALLATTVAALPSVVGGDRPSGSRLVVAGAVGLAGALGYVLHRPGRPLMANISANQALRVRWQQRVAAVKAENARRRDDVRLAIRAGEPTAIKPSGR
jgi:hypothetical protein